ncbi:hypothetical protein F4821DRAFT_261672 [Hypoxylon rubiginosum]|uniref:Uncharacterized protein n=1 Tax=Hypoxylon rubiginosum TaxID=110542 RepID=A0ACC0CXF5_9PEZI|nr:hypothetical protein F4821DRAFT_261672 [Hypoxylon rubiginosum]
MMLYDNFPYQDINLRRRYDFLLVEELKIKYCTMSQKDISVQTFNFHLRAFYDSWDFEPTIAKHLLVVYRINTFLQIVVAFYTKSLALLAD